MRKIFFQGSMGLVALAMLVAVVGCEVGPASEGDADVRQEAQAEDADVMDAERPMVPVWILRDCNGQEVQGAFTPAKTYSRYYEDHLTYIPEPGERPDYADKFIVSYLGATPFHGATFDLATGRMEPCYQEKCAACRTGASIAGASYAVYLDDQCQGTRFVLASAVEQEPYILDGGVMLSAWGAPDILTNPTVIYVGYQGDEACRESDFEQWIWARTQGQDEPPYPLWRLRPVPSRIVDAFPDPPYTVTMEYR